MLLHTRARVGGQSAVDPRGKRFGVDARRAAFLGATRSQQHLNRMVTVGIVHPEALSPEPFSY
jgi:hypothetical protein